MVPWILRDPDLISVTGYTYILLVLVVVATLKLNCRHQKWRSCQAEGWVQSNLVVLWESGLDEVCPLKALDVVKCLGWQASVEVRDSDLGLANWGDEPSIFCLKYEHMNEGLPTPALELVSPQTPSFSMCRNLHCEQNLEYNPIKMF